MPGGSPWVTMYKPEYVHLLKALHKAADAFCAELQEDADGVPQDELKQLIKALDNLDEYAAAWEQQAGKTGPQPW